MNRRIPLISLSRLALNLSEGRYSVPCSEYYCTQVLASNKTTDYMYMYTQIIYKNQSNHDESKGEKITQNDRIYTVTIFLGEEAIFFPFLFSFWRRGTGQGINFL